MTDAPFQFFDVHVVRTERLSPTLLRATLTGDDLPRMASAGRDQRIKVFLPHPGQDAPVMPDTRGPDWYEAWRALDPDVRGIMRTYTIRALRPGSPGSPGELDIDFALHGTAGPASRWALTAAPGDRIGALAPVVADNVAYDFRPPAGTDWLLLAGDPSALPAVAAILESLPAGTPVHAYLEAPHPDDHLDLPTAATAHVTWLTGTPTTDALRTATLPDGTPYAWIAGESSAVKAIRRHLVSERGFDKRSVKFSGYWKRGTTEDQMMEAG
ncbi:siderophore-interacting protein [Streptomyces sp. NPDC060194]|uniref:siderophore-interacting protein n=1 Tax=Streptomyces sp. NPDC060194 TaxID=3347069 RepID=UPI003660C25B